MVGSVLKPDGERFLPEFSGLIALEHYHRYLCALKVIKNRRVLDLASGEGFGSNILSLEANKVFGVDISPEAIFHASHKYVRSNLQFIVGSATEIPLEDCSVDAAVSFETIEHFADHEKFLHEIKRVLQPGGFLIISTPNKLVYSDLTGYSNPFHEKELYTSEFLEIVARYFAKVRHYGQRVAVGSLISCADSLDYFSTFRPNSRTNGIADQVYDILVASDIDPPSLGHSVFEDPSGTLQAEQLDELVDECQRLRLDLETCRFECEALSKECDDLRALLRSN